MSSALADPPGYPVQEDELQVAAPQVQPLINLAAQAETAAASDTSAASHKPTDPRKPAETDEVEEAVSLRRSSGRARSAPVRAGMVDVTRPGVSFATPKGGSGRIAGKEKTAEEEAQEEEASRTEVPPEAAAITAEPEDDKDDDDEGEGDESDESESESESEEEDIVRRPKRARAEPTRFQDEKIRGSYHASKEEARKKAVKGMRQQRQGGTAAAGAAVVSGRREGAKRQQRGVDSPVAILRRPSKRAKTAVAREVRP